MQRKVIRGKKKIPNHLASASGQAFFPSNCITSSLPLEKQSLSCLRLFTLRLKKTNCPISALREEVLRFSLTLLDCPPKFFQAPSPRVLQICRNPVRKKESSLGLSLWEVFCTLMSNTTSRREWLAEWLNWSRSSLGWHFYEKAMGGEAGARVYLYLCISWLESRVQKRRAGGGLTEKGPPPLAKVTRQKSQ